LAGDRALTIGVETVSSKAGPHRPAAYPATYQMRFQRFVRRRKTG